MTSFTSLLVLSPGGGGKMAESCSRDSRSVRTAAAKRGRLDEELLLLLMMKAPQIQAQAHHRTAAAATARTI